MRHVEWGGEVFGLVDLDGDAARIAAGIEAASEELVDEYPWIAMFSEHAGAIASGLGLTDVSAIGLSSVRLPDGMFRNRTFIHTPRGRHGLLDTLGGSAGPFRDLHLAPADTDFYYEAEFDLSRAYQIFQHTMRLVVGRALAGFLDGRVDGFLGPMGDTAREILWDARGRITVIVVIDPEQTAFLQLDKPLKVPASSVFVRIDGIGRTLIPVLDEVPILEVALQSGRKMYGIVGQPLVSSWTPAVAVIDDALIFSSSQAFMHACLDRQRGLAHDAEFTSALAFVGGEGNTLSYATPRLYEQLRRVRDLNPRLVSDDFKHTRFLLRSRPAPPAAVISVRSNLPDGLLYCSRTEDSLKRDIVMTGVYNPLTVATSFAVLEPFVRRARASVEEMKITNNLRQLLRYSRKHCYDHEVTTVRIDAVMGREPGKLLPEFEPVAGERYDLLVFTEGFPLQVTTDDGRVIAYGP